MRPCVSPMSSRLWLSGLSGLCVFDHGSVDDVGESPIEDAECLSFGLAAGHVSGDEFLGWRVDPELGYCDSVDGSIGLGVAAPVETKPRVVETAR